MGGPVRRPAPAAYPAAAGPASPETASGVPGSGGLSGSSSPPDRRSPETADDEELEEAPRPWWQVPVAILLGLFVLVAALYLLPGYIGLLSSPPSHPPTPKGELTDLCNRTLGTNCAGNELLLPRSNSNLSACEQVPHSGPNEQLWLNYSLSARLVGVLLMYSGYAGLLSHGASAFLANGSLDAAVAWSVDGATGSDTNIVSVPGTSTTWCLVWWVPSGSATLTWSSDATITWDAPS